MASASASAFDCQSRCSWCGWLAANAFANRYQIVEAFRSLRRFAPGTGVLSKTESEDGNKFTRGLRNSISCEEEPTSIL